MVYYQYPDNQPPAVPWPADYDDQDPKRQNRTPLLGGLIAGLVAVLVLAVGVVVGIQLGGSEPAPPADPSPSVTAVGPSAVAPPTIPESAPRQAEQRRREATRLDRSTYESVGAREFALMVKSPDSWAGRKIVVYGVVTQFDAATGPTAFRADTGPAPMANPYGYDQNTFMTAHDANMVADIVEKDMVTMYVEVQGSYTYDTQIGGSTTVPALLVNIIEPTRMPTVAPLPTVARLPSPQPDVESVSASRLKAIAATDRPVVSAALADRWVPQLSSKYPGLVAEGQTWTNAAILAEHEQLRRTYPGVRLLWTGDWSTFSDSTMWVTVAGTTFPTAEGALAWCTSSGRGRDHCFAKLISTTHPVEGSTDYN